jgi:hypothetical protein
MKRTVIVQCTGEKNSEKLLKRKMQHRFIYAK